MAATGIFEVKLELQDDKASPSGRMLINKNYSGDFIGTGTGQMISKRTEGGDAAYFAIEEVEGEVAGRTGSFTLLHEGTMSGKEQSLTVKIMQGSGGGELKNISGNLEIIQKDGVHKYVLNYEI